MDLLQLIKSMRWIFAVFLHCQSKASSPVKHDCCRTFYLRSKRRLNFYPYPGRWCDCSGLKVASWLCVFKVSAVVETPRNSASPSTLSMQVRDSFNERLNEQTASAKLLPNLVLPDPFIQRPWPHPTSNAESIPEKIVVMS